MKTGWWVQYQKPSCSKMVVSPLPGVTPAFQEGQLIRLRGKPEKPRRVLAVEWHRHRYEFVYVVETSAPIWLRPYWFGPQLELVTASKPLADSGG
jgi:hypothetical protein